MISTPKKILSKYISYYRYQAFSCFHLPKKLTSSNNLHEIPVAKYSQDLLEQTHKFLAEQGNPEIKLALTGPDEIPDLKQFSKGILQICQNFKNIQFESVFIPQVSFSEFDQVQNLSK